MKHKLKKGSIQQITRADITRALINIQSDFTDEMIFTSNPYQEKIRFIGRFITGKTKIPISSIVVWEEWEDGQKNMTAATNGEIVTINSAALPIHQRFDLRSDRHMAIVGLAVHEFAHCVFTDFKTLQDAFEKITKEGLFYPQKPTETKKNKVGIEGYTTFCDNGPVHRGFLLKYFHTLDNIIEDGYVERSITTMFPGELALSLDRTNEAFMHTDGYMGTVKERFGYFEHNEKFNSGRDFYISNWDLLTSAIHHISVCGEIDIDPSYNPQIAEISKRIELYLSDLKREVNNANTLSRKTFALRVMLENWDFILEDAEFLQLKERELQAKVDKQLKDEIMDALYDLIKELLTNCGIGSEMDENSENLSDGFPITCLLSSPPPSPTLDGEDSDDDGDDDGDDDNGKSSGDKDLGEHNEGETVTITLSLGEEEIPDLSTPAFEGIETAVSDVESELSKPLVNEVVESLLEEMLQGNAIGSKATSDNAHITVTRPPVNEGAITRYDRVWCHLESVSRDLKRKLEKILMTRRRGQRQTGFAFGKRLDSRSFGRYDEKFFSKTNAPSDSPSVATALLIDASGSMMRYAKSPEKLYENKMQAASNTALVLYDFCVGLNFPIMVASHCTEYSMRAKNSDVRIDTLAAFQNVNETDRYRIAGMESGGGNRDGTALNYVLSELKQRPEETKLLFIISDGLPTDYNDYEDGVLHLQEVMEEAKKADVLIFAAALDEDIPAIKGIYGEQMFEMTDLERMPRTLLDVLKNFIR